VSLIVGLTATSFGLTLNPGLVVSTAFPIILQYAPELVEEFTKSAVFGEAWNVLKRWFVNRKGKGTGESNQEILEELHKIEDNKEELKSLVVEINDAINKLTEEREDCAVDVVRAEKELISQEEFVSQISDDVSERLQSGLRSYLKASRVSGENKLEIEKQKDEILSALQKIGRKDLKELREDEDLEDPRVNIIKDRVLVESKYLTEKAKDVISSVLSGRSIFIVGEAGVGKSKLLYSIWKELKERGENVAYLLNLRETPIYDGVLFYDNFTSELFDPLVFPALTNRKFVLTIRDVEYEKIQRKQTLRDIKDATVFIDLNKSDLEHEFLLELTKKYLGEYKLEASDETVNKILYKSEGLPIYISTLIEQCASRSMKIEDCIEKVPSGIYKLIGEILLDTFYKAWDGEIEVWAFSTLAALAQWEGNMHEKHLEALKQEIKDNLKRLDDTVKFRDLLLYKYLLIKSGQFYFFKHSSWVEVVSAIYGNKNKLEDFGDLAEDLGVINKYLRYSTLNFDHLLKSAYFKALEESKEATEKFDLLYSYLFFPSNYFSEIKMYTRAVDELAKLCEEHKTYEFALAMGLVNLITLLGERGMLENAEEREKELKKLYDKHKTSEFASVFSRGLYNLITYFSECGELTKAEEKEKDLKDLYDDYETPEITSNLASGLYNLVTYFSTYGNVKKAEEKEKELIKLYREHKTHEIALELANGLVNLIFYFGEREDFAAIKREEELKDIYVEYRTYEEYRTPKISEAFARGLRNLMAHFINKGKLEEAIKREEEVKELYKNHHKTHKIALELATVLRNLIIGFRDHNNLEEAVKRQKELKELCEEHKTPEFAEIYTEASKLIPSG
jgi:DNA replication protein DnaC/predicted GIY-YIG superfamily endonuclease